MFELVIQLEHVRVTDRCNVWKEKVFLFSQRDGEKLEKKKKKRKEMDKWYWIKEERNVIDRIVSWNFFF